jgi:hypothetical protein
MMASDRNSAQEKRVGRRVRLVEKRLGIRTDRLASPIVGIDDSPIALAREADAKLRMENGLDPSQYHG